MQSPYGRINLSLRETGFEQGQAIYTFTCSDEGCGMTEEFQKHAFEPFTQERDRARSVYGGSGLALLLPSSS